MSDKNNDRFTIGVIAGIILIFALADFVARFGLTGSEGKFGDEKFFRQARYEKMVFDIRLMLGKRETGDYFIGKNGRVFEQHLAKDYSQETILESMGVAGKLAKEYSASLMLIPSADEIWKEDLPKYADVFDQNAYLELLQNTGLGDSLVDVRSVLKEHAVEKLYYDTDPHWTNIASYYAYLAWREKNAKQQYYFDVDHRMMVTKRFQGAYAALKNLDLKADALYIFKETYQKPVTVWLDESVERQGYYRPEYIIDGNPYYYFLGNDFVTARIETGRDRDKTLFVIGDSYANCMIPFLAPHYREITFLNMENFQGDLWETLDAEICEDADVLLLQSVPGFLDCIGRLEIE